MRSFALPCQKLLQAFNFLEIFPYTRFSCCLAHPFQSFPLLLEGLEFFALQHRIYLLLILVHFGQYSIFEFVGNVGVKFDALFCGQFQQRLSFQFVKSSRQEFLHFGDRLQEIVHVGVGHYAVLKGLLGLHRRRRMIIMEERTIGTIKLNLSFRSSTQAARSTTRKSSIFFLILSSACRRRARLSLDCPSCKY